MQQQVSVKALFCKIFYKVLTVSCVFILRGEAGVSQISRLTVEFPQAAVVKLLVVIVDDEGDDAEGQAVFEEQQASYSSISILEGMNGFKVYMKFEQVVEIMVAFVLIMRQQFLDFFCYIIGRAGFFIANGIGQSFVFAHIEPVKVGIGGIGFEDFVQLLDKLFICRLVIVFQDIVKGPEVVHGFDDVIAVDDFVAVAENRMGVEQVYGMLMAELAAFDAVAVVGKAGLRIMINTVFIFGSLFCF